MSKPTAQEIHYGPHAEFSGHLDGNYGKVVCALHFDTASTYGPGTMMLTAQIGSEFVESVRAAIDQPAKRSYGHRIELEFRNGATAHRLKFFSPILTRFEKVMNERNLHIDYAAFETIAAILIHAAKLRYVFINPVNPEGRRIYGPANVPDWQLLDMNNIVDSGSFGMSAQATVTNLWRKATPISVMHRAQQEAA